MQWLVRSQDKKFIVSIDNVEAVTVNGKHIVRGGGRVLGEYKSTRRCVRVIANMMKFINTRDKLLLFSKQELGEDLFGNDNSLFQKGSYINVYNIDIEEIRAVPFRDNSVFQMPKE